MIRIYRRQAPVNSAVKHGLIAPILPRTVDRALHNTRIEARLADDTQPDELKSAKGNGRATSDPPTANHRARLKCLTWPRCLL